MPMAMWPQEGQLSLHCVAWWWLTLPGASYSLSEHRAGPVCSEVPSSLDYSVIFF